MTAADVVFPVGSADEKELLLQWLAYLREAVISKLDDLEEAAARRRPQGRLISLLGIVNHLTKVEWRWIDGGFRGAEVSRHEGEFSPGAETSISSAITRYRERGAATEALVRDLPLTTVGNGWADGHDLRFVLLHLINETARHAGHADATRELLDGRTGE